MKNTLKIILIAFVLLASCSDDDDATTLNPEEDFLTLEVQVSGNRTDEFSIVQIRPGIPMTEQAADRTVGPSIFIDTYTPGNYRFVSNEPSNNFVIAMTVSDFTDLPNDAAFNLSIRAFFGNTLFAEKDYAFDNKTTQFAETFSYID